LNPTKICIDGFNLAMSKGSGIATYARNLNSALRTLGYQTHILYGPEQGLTKDPLLNEIALFDAPTPPSLSRWFSDFRRNLASLRNPLGRTAVGLVSTGGVITRQVEQAAPPRDRTWIAGDIFHGANRAYSALGRFTPLRFDGDAAERPDVVHWTCTLPIRAPQARNLYTIHDLVPLRLPFATLDNKRRFLAMCREIRDTADHIVTVSEHSKQDLVRILGVKPDAVTVTYQSVELPAAMLARPDTDVAKEIEGVFGLGWRDYFVFFGAVEPKKNLARVIEAYLASGVSAPLVIIGGKAWLDNDEIQLMYEDIVEVSALRDGQIRRNDRVRRYEYLPFRLLTSLIRGAKATLLPSLYEGFGLPVLESMLLGTPVLSSTAGSLPEIAGDGALLVDPYDTLAIRKAIEALDADEGLRSSLTERGLLQAAKFSPAAYQERLGALYRTLH
jgi:glycosyltransferase involved in cell wall biosynthesis